METVTSLKVNWSKSTLSPVRAIPNIQRLAAMLECDAVLMPITFLGLPLGTKASSVDIWNPIIKRMSRKLSCWKGKLLSRGGKLVLLKSMLASVPIYFLSLFQAPKSVINQLEKIQRDFLWNSDREGRKIHWVGWKNVCKPMNQGGLGIKSLSTISRALLDKWLWRFGVERNALWWKLVEAKYGEDHSWRSSMPERVMGCSLWSGICKGTDSFFKFVYKINNGERVSFWHDA